MRKEKEDDDKRRRRRNDLQRSRYLKSTNHRNLKGKNNKLYQFFLIFFKSIFVIQGLLYRFGQRDS